ncbi:MAG: hypothetical protein Q9227_005201 [Pyrenula ochraceoflavens]
MRIPGGTIPGGTEEDSESEVYADAETEEAEGDGGSETEGDDNEVAVADTFRAWNDPNAVVAYHWNGVVNPKLSRDAKLENADNFVYFALLVMCAERKHFLEEMSFPLGEGRTALFHTGQLVYEPNRNDY